MSRSRATGVLAAVTGTTAALVLGPLAGPASAHVTVQGPGAAQGGYAKLVFRVPTEKDVATTGLEIAFPADAPIASVRVKPHAGWTARLVEGAPPAPLEVHGRQVTEVVQRIVWTATGPGIGASEFDEFEVAVGPLPEVDQLVFKALQTYADGEVVRWIEEPVEGAPDPEKPAPVLALAPAEDGGHGGAAPVDAEPVAATSPEGQADGLGLAALVVSGLALALGGTALLRARRG